jgi:dihydrofolate reductase
MKLNIIVAMCKYTNGIGVNNELPWRIKEDLHYFSRMTKGNGNNVIIMGTNTYNSLQKPGLPGRDNFILSSSLKMDFTLEDNNSYSRNCSCRRCKLPDLEERILNSAFKEEECLNKRHIVKSFSTIEELIETCYANNYNTAWVIGGASIYKQFLHTNLIDKCYVTFIHKLFECDTFFPFLLDMDNWHIERKTELKTDKDITLEMVSIITHHKS